MMCADGDRGRMLCPSCGYAKLVCCVRACKSASGRCNSQDQNRYRCRCRYRCAGGRCESLHGAPHMNEPRTPATPPCTPPQSSVDSPHRTHESHDTCRACWGVVQYQVRARGVRACGPPRGCVPFRVCSDQCGRLAASGLRRRTVCSAVHTRARWHHMPINEKQAAHTPCKPQAQRTNKWTTITGAPT